MIIFDLAVIIPVYNEETNLEELYKRMLVSVQQLKMSYEFIFVNDGSTDRSLEIIKNLNQLDLNVKYINFSRNFGQQVAVSAGIDHAIAKYIAIIDADLQDPPEALLPLYSRLNEGFDVVYARRRKRKGESFLKKITAKSFYRILRGITSIDIPVDTGDFRIMKGKVAEVLRKMPEQQKFIRGQIAWTGFRQGYIEYDRDSRGGGKTGYSYGKMMHFAKDGITSFSDFPMKLVTWSGFFVAFIAFLVAIYSLYSKFVLGGAVPGWASLMISLLFLGGVQLISLGIIGEYIGRIASNIRNRPLYIIEDTNIN
jgi:polyisoprenyl-phosphate glycosyltransferase